VDRSGGDARLLYPIEYSSMFHMTNDSGLFRTAAQLEKAGFYRVEGRRWKKGKEDFSPLLEGKMVQAFDHRAANVVVNAANLNRPAIPEPATPEQSVDPAWLPNPQFFVADSDVIWPKKPEWGVAFKDVTAPTNVRSMIAAIVPKSGCGNTLPVLLPGEDGSPNHVARFVACGPLLAANFNAIPFDYVARQKIQGQHLNWYIVEQLPVIPPEAYARKFGKKTAAELVKAEVLKLTYVSHDMAQFARDMGYEGKPFPWDPKARRHSRARLDALYFHLYGVSEADASYMLETFPIVKREDEAEFGRYLTKDLALGYYRAFAAGDTVSKIAG
jgi:hypothetical protein